MSLPTTGNACFDLPLEVVFTRNPIMCNKRAADPVHADLASLLVKNNNLLDELRNLQKLFTKETSLHEMKSELESCKENKVKQSFQIMFLKNDIKDLQELIASLTRIKSLKSINVQSLERSNWDLNEKIIELENHIRVRSTAQALGSQRRCFPLDSRPAGHLAVLWIITLASSLSYSIRAFPLPWKAWCGVVPRAARGGSGLVHLFERKKAEQKTDLLEKKLAGDNGFTPYMNMKGQENTLGSVVIKRTEDFQQKIQMLIQQQDQLHHHHEVPSQNEEKCREQKRSLKWLEEKFAINDFFQGRLDLGKNKENLKSKSSQIDENSKMFKQLEKDNYKQQTLLNIKQNLMIVTTQRLEGEIQKLQKQISDLKLSSKNMKTLLTRVNVLKDITVQKLKLRQHLIEVEAMKGKAVMKTGDLKTTLDSAKQEARWDKEGAHQILDAVTSEPRTARSTIEEVPGQPQEHVDFRETIMKMLGFNTKAADKEIITHLKLIIRAYDTSNKSKIDSDSRERPLEDDKCSCLYGEKPSRRRFPFTISLCTQPKCSGNSSYFYERQPSPHHMLTTFQEVRATAHARPPSPAPQLRLRIFAQEGTGKVLKGGVAVRHCRQKRAKMTQSKLEITGWR
ncbi:uncharacterized protein V5649_013727 [Rhynchonycteris naso]